MSLVTALTEIPFAGSHRGRPLTVTVEPWEDPPRARLEVDGVTGEPRPLPARFDLPNGAAVVIERAGRAITRCAVVEGEREVGLTLAPDSALRRFIVRTDDRPVWEIVRFVVWGTTLLLLVAGVARLINVSILERPLSWLGVSQPVDLPFPSVWWLIPLAIGLTVLLDGEEKLRRTYRPFLRPTLTRLPERTADVPVRPAAIARPDDPVTATAEPDGDGLGQRIDRWGDRIGAGFEAFTRQRFRGRHDGHDLLVTFDFFDQPTHARLTVDGEDRGNHGVPARFDLGGGATLEADATSWAVRECAVVVDGARTRLTPLDDEVESWLGRFWDRHPRLETVTRTVGAALIIVGGGLGAIDLWNLVIGTDLGRAVTDWIGFLGPIPLPFDFRWWQGLLVSAIPAAFEFERDARRSARTFRPQRSAARTDPSPTS